MTNTLFIKNMVCPRCITVVKDELSNLGLTVEAIELGKAEIKEFDIRLSEIRTVLEKHGFELIEDQEAVLVAQTKKVLLELLDDTDLLHSGIKTSEHLESKLETSYYSLSKVFSKSENITIEKFFIRLRIEKAKELLEYNELSAQEIAVRLGYGSVQHFYSQFKAVSGLSLKEYKNGEGGRQSLDSL